MLLKTKTHLGDALLKEIADGPADEEVGHDVALDDPHPMPEGLIVGRGDERLQFRGQMHRTLMWKALLGVWEPEGAWGAARTCWGPVPSRAAWTCER